MERVHIPQDHTEIVTDIFLKVSARLVITQMQLNSLELDKNVPKNQVESLQRIVQAQKDLVQVVWDEAINSGLDPRILKDKQNNYLSSSITY